MFTLMDSKHYPYICLTGFIQSYVSFALTYFLCHLACEEGTWGDNCANICSCHHDNTVTCNSTSGYCSCMPGWQGLDCSDDVDECKDNTIDCPDSSDCINIPGSYICACQTGHIKTSTGACIGKYNQITIVQLYDD